MTLPELHPDELLSREASSTLTPREWADLSAHLQRCPACALERAARREAAAVRAPSDLDHAIAARVVSRILAGHERELASPKRGRAQGGRRLAYAALVLLLASGTAMAGVALVAQIRQRQAARLESEGRRSPRAPLAPAALEPARQPTEIPAPPPAVAVRSETGAGRPVAVSRHRPAPASAARAEHAPVDGATLLAQAEDAESAGRIADANRLYDELHRGFAGTREEIVARALHGQLLLDRVGSPIRALALFEGYLATEPTGTLAEEVRVGRARALERLGRSDDERAAWLELLRAHPTSVHAAAARARLSALEQR